MNLVMRLEKNKKNKVELKLRFGSIFEKLSGIHPKSNSKGGFKNIFFRVSEPKFRQK